MNERKSAASGEGGLGGGFLAAAHVPPGLVAASLPLVTVRTEPRNRISSSPQWEWIGELITVPLIQCCSSNLEEQKKEVEFDDGAGSFWSVALAWLARDEPVLREASYWE